MESIKNQHLQFSWINFCFIIGIHILAFIGLCCGILGYIPEFFGWYNILVFFLMYYITGCLGITLGYHRLLTHKSFETKVWVEFFLIMCGLLALKSNPIDWVSDYRIHHIHSDDISDKHNSKRGFL